MKLLIDTNLLFSSISKPEGKIAEIILNPHFHLEFTSCYFSYIELFKYKDRLIKYSKLDEPLLLEIMYQVIKRVHFYNESFIPENCFSTAYNLVKDIDSKDTVFMAMSIHLNLKLWTGDLQLATGLRKKGFQEVILTNELLELLSKPKY